MIVTVTLNPAYDHLLFLHDIDVGRLNRTHSTSQMPGGKGVNAAGSLGSQTLFLEEGSFE